MKILCYSIKAFEKPYLQKANTYNFRVEFREEALHAGTAPLALGYDAVSVFAGDDVSTPVLQLLKDAGVSYIALRSAGYDNVDLCTARKLGLKVAYVPEYSPYAIAEHATALLLALNRNIVESHKRVSGFNFDINGLTGFDLHKKTVGLIGTGRIGGVMAKIMNGFGCNLLGYDISENEELKQMYGLEYTTLKQLCAQSDILSVHTPLNKATHHLLHKDLFAIMKKGVVIINTARGAVIKTEDLLDALENKIVGGAGMDVYEREKGIFFKDCTKEEIKDPVLKRLIDMPNVLITSHHAFLTREALTNIAETVFQNLYLWKTGKRPVNELK